MQSLPMVINPAMLGKMSYDYEKDLAPVALESEHYVTAATPDASVLAHGNATLTRLVFRNLIEKGFYNGLAVHRAVKDYLVQTGDSASRRNNT